METRFAEERFPLKEISEISSKEKSIRHGHISTLHIWWARRPLAASRAMNYAALIPRYDKFEEIERKKSFIVKLSRWENSLDDTLLDQARKDILDTNDGKPPKILDPFAGGGSIPLEALRLGCETYANDYNPVATLILKCVLQFPQKYGRNKIKSEVGLVSEKKNQLIEDIKRWANIVADEVKKEIWKFYDTREEDIPVGYLWARTITCQNPSCNGEIPLIRQYWLCKRKNKTISLYPYVHNSVVNFKIVGTKNGDKIPKSFDPEKGTVARAVVICLVCGSVIDNKTTSRLFREHKSGQRMIAVVLHREGMQGKTYRLAIDEDMRMYNNAKKYLETKILKLSEEFGLNPIPDEPTPDGRGRGAERAFGIRNYGMNSWGDLFNARQKLTLITLVEKIRNAYTKMTKLGYDEDYAKVIVSYLALAMDMTAAFTNSLARWENTSEIIKQLFSRQVLSMVWDYAEVNPFSNSSGSFETGWKYYLKVIEHCSHISNNKISVTQSSATSLRYPNDFFDAVFTDPPYYDNVPYSHLSDFFYVWLKRTLGEIYPDLFSTPLTPKSKEIVAYGNTQGDFEAGKKFFEELLKTSFREISRVLKSNGICIIVYAHKSTAGWETLINSLLDSGLVVTAAWPINTEMKERLRATESAALASSIYMVAGKYKKKSIGFYKDIKSDLRKHLNNELEKLWKEGVSGADFFISAIGSSIEVFGMYEKIIDDEGNQIRADKLLEEVRRIVTDYAVKQVLHNGFVEEITQMTRLYVLWRWAYGESRILFDDARKLAQSVGIDLTNSWNKGFIQKDKEFIRILGPSERMGQDLVNSRDLIDVLHRVLLLWNNGKSSEIITVLKDSPYGRSDVFYRIAQAISESLPNESKEKKWIEGFLAGKIRLSRELKVESGQQRLFE